ncbi:MAG: (d)CMP kinase [Flavobacteriales bacterium]|nr:(d)CMP kinase [Flavobacteriales bacterium]
MRKISISIDGHSSCGKSTLAKQLANEFGYFHVDTGAMYRAVALFCIQNEIVQDWDLDVDKLEAEISKIDLSYNVDKNGKAETILNGISVETQIRRPEVSNAVSIISKEKIVRVKLVQIQQALAKEKGVVMDGRDIGTVVIPDAELKIFLTANVNVRAERRLLELHKSGVEIGIEEVLENLEQRDLIDSTRKISPLKKADDAVLIDNSFISREEQLSQAVALAKKAIAAG